MLEFGLFIFIMLVITSTMVTLTYLIDLYITKLRNQVRLKRLRRAHDYKVHHPHCGLRDSNSFNFFKKSPRLK